MKNLNIIEIGFGPHAKRVYGPALQEWGHNFNCRLALVLDLKQQETEIREYFASSTLEPELVFVEMFENEMPSEVEQFLTKYVEENDIQGIIISTDPLVHFLYARWALDMGLNILMDKPITTGRNVVSDESAAIQIEADYIELLHKYTELQKTKKTSFLINVQRRFHPGFELVGQMLSEISLKTNCPITSIQSYHCDGQWRLPSEISTQTYHPFNVGYGKASHSGYHIFDIIYNFYKVSKLTDKFADSMEIVSSLFQPRGFLYQLNENDYQTYFGEDYLSAKKYVDNELYAMFENYGEIDLSAIIRLKHRQECVGNITINLVHNGFSMRTWVLPGLDLYKGNGRVKHEHHNIQQGPFQNIQIHSYQSKDKHDVNTIEDYNIGGNNHFDIYIFRNKGMTGDKETLKVVRMNDLKADSLYLSDDELVVERVKHKVVIEFLSFLQGLVSKDRLTSNIEDHMIPVQIMSGIYRSHNQYIRGRNPLVLYSLA